MTSKAQQRQFISTADEHQKVILQTIRSLAYSRGIERVWADWIEMCAIALAKVDLAQADVREQRYLQIVSEYEKQEVQELVHAFARLVMAMEARVTDQAYGDLLGSTFMMLDMGNASGGRFFTPYEVSRLMGQLIMPGEQLRKVVQDRGFVRLMEPAVGAGGMVIAAAHALAEEGLNYQQQLHVTAIDVDIRCVHMAFVQFALLNIPAMVVHGNALTRGSWSNWFTPAHILGGWNSRLASRRNVEQTQSVLEASNVEAETVVVKPLSIGPAPGG